MRRAPAARAAAGRTAGPPERIGNEPPTARDPTGSSTPGRAARVRCCVAGVAAGPGTSERRSRWSAVAGTSGPGYQAHIYCAGRPATAGTGGRCQYAVADCPGSPPAAGRAWVPGCRARTLGP